MLEKTIEKKLTAAVKKAGGIAPKFVSPSFAGMPDHRAGPTDLFYYLMGILP